MQIFIKNLIGRWYTVEVEEDDTVEKVKKDMYRQSGIPEVVQAIIYGGRVLSDHWKLSDLNIMKESTVHLVNVEWIRWLFNFSFDSPEFLKNQTVSIEVSYSDSIGDVKAELQNLTGIDIQNMKMWADGKVLDDYQWFIDLGIGIKSIINVVYIE